MPKQLGGMTEKSNVRHLYPQYGQLLVKPLLTQQKALFLIFIMAACRLTAAASIVSAAENHFLPKILAMLPLRCAVPVLAPPEHNFPLYI